MAPGRLAPVAPDIEDPALDEVFAPFRARGRDLPMLYRTLANAPAMLRAWTALAWPLRSDASTPRGLRELVIMRVAQLTAAEAEWLAHWPMAVHHGVTDDQLAALSNWHDSDLFDDDERAVLQFTDELTTDVEASEAAFKALADRFDAGAVVELTLTAAFYNCVSRVLRTLGLGPADREDARLADFGRRQ